VKLVLFEVIKCKLHPEEYCPEEASQHRSTHGL
jgi:hypothetical protein